MKRILKSCTALVLIAWLVLCMAAPATAAPAARAAFSAQTTVTDGNIITPPEDIKWWITQDNIMQIKRVETESELTGTISGRVRLEISQSLNMDALEGAAHGKFVLTATEGTFQGSFSGQITDLSISGTFVAHGTGAYEGQKIMGSVEVEVTPADVIMPNFQMTMNGILLNPEG